MSSVAEQIAEKFVTLASVPAMSSTEAIFRDINRALTSAEQPSVAIELGDEVQPSRVLISKYDRRVEIAVQIISGGVIGDDSPYTSGDAVMTELHARIMADPTLGGIAMDVIEGPTQRTREQAEDDYARVRKTYFVEYRTAPEIL